MTERSTNQPDDASDAGTADFTQGRDLSSFFRHVEQYLTDPATAHDWNASENTSAGRRHLQLSSGRRHCRRR